MNATVLAAASDSPLTCSAWCPSSSFLARNYTYVEHGGSGASSVALGVDEHSVIKTLVFQEVEGEMPFVVLQHGDATVDTKKMVRELARTRGQASGLDGSGVDGAPIDATGRKRCFMVTPEVAQSHTGYQVGGTSPFGLQTPSMRIFIESSLLTLLPAAAPATVEPKGAELAQKRTDEIESWDSQLSRIVDFTQLDTRAAKSSTLDLVTPAWVLINGGARGSLVTLSVREIVRVLRPIVVNVAKTTAAEAAEEKPAKKEKALKTKGVANNNAAASASPIDSSSPVAAAEA